MHAPYFDRIKAWRKYKGNPIVGGTGDQARGRVAKVYERARQKTQQQMVVGDKRGRHGGGLPPGQVGISMPPRSMLPPRGVVPHGMPGSMPIAPAPRIIPGMPPPGMQPQGMPRGPYGPPTGGPPPGGGQGIPVIWDTTRPSSYLG